MNGLTPEQQAAVDATDGRIFVDADCWSGRVGTCDRSKTFPAVSERRKATTGFLPDCRTLRRWELPTGATVKEEWRPVIGYEGLYEVSNLGNVRSVDRFVPRRDRWGNQSGLHLKGCQLYVFVTKNRRCCVSVSKAGKLKTLQVHELVCDAFHPNPKCLPEVNHKDGNPLNNNESNLEHCTHQENHAHARLNGLLGFGISCGEQNGYSKLTASKVRAMRRAFAEGKRIAVIAREFQVGWSCCKCAVVRITWRHV